MARLLDFGLSAIKEEISLSKRQRTAVRLAGIAGGIRTGEIAPGKGAEQTGQAAQPGSACTVGDHTIFAEALQLPDAMSRQRGEQDWRDFHELEAACKPAH